MTETVAIGRNEPCSCKSGKKYKRCCGVNAAPKLSVRAQPDPNHDNPLEGMDPQLMAKLAKAFQKLPKGQVQRFQGIMQKAMRGKDISSEAQEFEKTLPLEFQTMVQSMSLPDSLAISSQNASKQTEEGEETSMTLEKARQLVSKAASDGALSQEQAKQLLSESSSHLKELGQVPSKLSRFWNTVSGKKNP